MRRVLLILTLLSLFGCFSEYALSEEGLKADGALDAILVMDSSGSMLLTDPGRLRDEGAKLFIQSLKAGDKFGLIQFSDSAKLVRDLTDYKPDQNSKISEEIAKIDNDGIYTDLLSGIKLAQEIFKKNQATGREQIIVLFSDGKMDPDPLKATPKAQNGELFNNYLPDLKSRGIKVHTLALSDKADKDLLAQISAATEGISIYASDATLIHQAFTNLFLAVKKPQVLPLTSKGFKIDAEVQEATFYINREEENQEIVIVSPSGKKYSHGLTDVSVKWFRSPKFDVITIQSPEAGDWRIEGMKSQDAFATLLTNLKLVTKWPAPVSAEEDTLLQVRLYEDDKPVVLHGMSGALDYAFQIVPTDKISEPIIKEFLNDEGKNGDAIANDGIFSKLVNIAEPGQYVLKVVAHSPTFDRYQHLPFQVKERMVSLSIVSHAPTVKDTAAHHDEHTDGHDDKHEDGHTKDGTKDSTNDVAQEEKVQDQAGHDKKGTDEGHHEGGDEDYFQAKLSQEVLELKKLEVKIVAVDKDRNRYTIELEPSEDHNIYEVPVDALPEPGLYEVEANILGTNKNKKEVKATSQRIKYLLKKSGKEVKVEVEEKENGKEIKIENKKEQKEPEGPNVLLWIGLATLFNLIAGGVSFLLFKKASSGPKISIPVFEDVEITKKTLQSLRDKLSVSEVDLSDPKFSGSFTATEEPKPQSEPAAEPQPSADLLSPQAEQEPATEGGEPPQEPQEQV